MVSIRVILVLLAVLLVSSGCMMPDPAKQRAANEARLLAEGLTVPFYRTNADGSYQTDEKEVPVLDPDVSAPPFSLNGPDGIVYSYDPATADGFLLILVVPTVKAPNSLQQLNKLASLAPALSSAGIDVVAISADPVSEVPSTIGKDGSTLYLLSDTTGDFLIPYGCKTDKMEFAQRTMIGLGPDGVVRFFTRGFAYQTEKQIKDAFGIAD